MKDKINLKKSKIYIIYTLLFCIVSLIVFAVFIKANKGFIWNIDGFKQHYVILYDFNQTLRNLFQDGFSMLSWDMGLGMDVIGQYSYYVMGDPFAYISLLFPMDWLETIYSALIILRMYCVGLAFIAYCRHQNKKGMPTLVGAICYTFCGFILYAGIRHPYFTNVAILLPLNFIAVDKLLKENKKWPLALMAFVSAVSNYYFFYMITVVNIIYAVVKYITEYNHGLKEFFKKVLTAGLCYIIGAMMAGAILLPTLYAFLNSARTSGEQILSYAPNYYKVLFMGFVSARHKNWTSIFTSSVILLMIPVLFTKLKEKECKTYAILFVITTIMLLIPFVSSVMNGLSFPNNRWVFAYEFILAYIITLCFDRKCKYTKKQIIAMAIVLVVYFVIGLIVTEFKIQENGDFYTAIAMAAVMWLVILLNNIKDRLPNKIDVLFKYSNIVIVLLIIGNIWVISFAMYYSLNGGYVNQFLDNNSAVKLSDTLNGKLNNFKDAVEYIKQNDKDFYRIAKSNLVQYNTSLLYDYHSIQTYLSIGNRYVYNLSHSLNDSHYMATKCINGMDRRTQVLTLLTTKYYICGENETESVPYGYEMYHKVGDTNIYINKNYLAVGTLYDSYILQEEYDKLNPLQKEQTLLSTAVLNDKMDSVTKEEKIEEKVDNAVKLSYKENGTEIEKGKVKVKKRTGKSIKLKVDDMQPNTEIYLNIKNLEYKTKRKKKNYKVEVLFNGITNSQEVKDRLSSAYYEYTPNFLMNLGVVKDKTDGEIEIKFCKRGTYTFDEIEVIAVPMKQYEENVEKLKKNQMTNVVYGNDYISGQVENDKAGVLQISTSYSSGWKAYIDGKEAEIIKVNEAFIGTFVEAGKHTVEFKYQTPYLKLGIVCSVLGIIAFVGLVVFEKRKE